MDLAKYNNRNWQNCFFDSAVPDICLKDPTVLGVDEAGRGPVLGPMVYGVAYCPLNKNDDLKQLGVEDSKTLSEEKRDSMFDIIKKNNDYIGWSIQILSPLYISNSMFTRPKISLNEVSHNSAADLIKRVMTAGVNLKSVFVDTVGDPQKYEDKLSNIFPTLSITVSKKADALFATVSAASICAKVARDRAVKEWKFPEGIEISKWGSGYPGDAATKNFLINSLDPIFGFPNLVRFSWSTAQKIINEKCISINWHDEDDEKENTPSVLQYFTKKRKLRDESPEPEKKPLKIHYFFSNKYLTRVKNL